jgi:hypothetical protein
VQVVYQLPKKRELACDGYLLKLDLLQAQAQPTDGRCPCARLLRVEFVPIMSRQVAKHGEAGLQAFVGFTLKQAPRQPCHDTQVLGLRFKEFFAAFANELPVCLRRLVKRGFARDFVLELFKLRTIP